MDLLFGREPSACKESVLGRSLPVITCSSLATVASVLINIGTRRPAFSGIQKHILAALAGGYAGEQLYHWRKRDFAERDAMLRHYIELHPEDFIEPPRLKYKDILDDWVPVR